MIAQARDRGELLSLDSEAYYRKALIDVAWIQLQIFSPAKDGVRQIARPAESAF